MCWMLVLVCVDLSKFIGVAEKYVNYRGYGDLGHC